MTQRILPPILESPLDVREKSAHSTVIVAACMDRSSTLKIVLRSWLSVIDVTEVILVDWSSNPPLVQLFPDLLGDSRLKIITVQGEKKWVLSWAYNLAAKLAPNGSFMLKVDCDTTLAPDFLQWHSLKKGMFYAGNWRLIETENSKHLNGIFYIETVYFQAIHGFDERIQTYGHDDTDLYSRLNESGLDLVPFDKTKVYHLDHPPNLRLSKQPIHDASFEIEKNRFLRSFVLAWNRSNKKVSFHIQADISVRNHYLATRTSSVASIESTIPQHTREYVERRAAQSVLRGCRVPWKGLTVPTAYMIKMIPSYRNERMLVVHVQYGLGNRLRAMASGMAISNRTGRHFRLIWQPDEHCNVRFQELFSNEIDVWDEFESNETSGANFERYNYMESKIGGVNGQIIETDTMNHIYVKTAYKLNHPEVKPKIMRQVLSELRLQPHITAMVDFLSKKSFIGVHIRNADPRKEIPGISDHAYSDSEWKRLESWRQSTNISIFEDEINRILEKNSQQYFFLSADSEKTINAMRNLFKERILFLENHACNNRSRQCMFFAAADLWILSSASEILGSPYSAFSEVAGLFRNRTTRYAGIDFPYTESDHKTRPQLSGRGDGVVYIDYHSNNNWKEYNLLESITSLHRVYKGEIPIVIFLDDDTHLNKSYQHLFRHIYHVNISHTTRGANAENTVSNSDKEKKLIISDALRKIQQLSNSPFEITLYVDGDTWFCGALGNLSQILGDRDILISNDVHHKSKTKSTWNSGVILYRNSPVVINFFKLWEKLYLQECTSSEINQMDSCGLSSALELSTMVRYSSLDAVYSFRLGSENQMGSGGKPEKSRTQLVSWPVRIVHTSNLPSHKQAEICRFVNEKPLKPRILGLTPSNELTMYYKKADCDQGTENNCNTNVF
ncbi:unnamed protein product [Rotaria socialis]